LTLREWIQEFLTDLKASGRPENTQKNYALFMNYFAEWCEKNSVDFLAANGKQFRRYRNHLVTDRELSPNTVNMCLYTLKTFYDFLVDDGEIAGNPVVTKRLTVTVENRLPDFLTEDELDTIFNSESYKNLPENVKLAMKTMLASGLRIGEVSNLVPQDVITQDGVVFLHVRAGHSKRKKERYVPVLDKEVAKELINFKGEFGKTSRNKDKLFGMGASRLADYFWKVKQETDVDFRSYRFRHTVGTRLANKGVRLDVIQEILGHANISTTRRYSATLPEAFFQIAKAVNQGGDLFGLRLSFAR